MTPEDVCRKKEDIVDSSATLQSGKKGANSTYIGPDIPSPEKTSAAIYGHLKDTMKYSTSMQMGDPSEDGHSMKLVSQSSNGY